jgi:carbamoyltransferase
MTRILGISAFYHDSAAALVEDGAITAAAQEERFTRKKGDADFPVHAIEYCLSEAGIGPEDIDYVGFYDKPLLKFDRLLETYLSYAPVGFGSFLKAMPIWLHKKLYLRREMSRGLGGRYRKRYVFTSHHESHAASAFFPSPFEQAAILTLDGVGEWATGTYGVGRGNRIRMLGEQRFPHSLGLLYSAFTYFCGFRVNSGEYKLMGLAPYGEPKHADVIREKMLDIREDGSFRMNMDYFNYCQGLTMTSEKFHRLLGGPPRVPETPITEREMDIAASIQVVTEEIMLRCARHVHRETGMKHLVLAGGVALNCVANGRILREGPYEDIWIQPAAGDAGGALGAALFIWHQLLDRPRRADRLDQQRGSLLGPRYRSEDVRAFLDGIGARYHRMPDENDLCDRVAGLLTQDKVVGWVQGRMEFGPRALGNRSILGDARSEVMQRTMNVKIKFRESFRPFAPSVLQERVHDYFETDREAPSPYMLLVAPVRESMRTPRDGEGPALKGIDKLKERRSVVPAITHVDYSARIQTVDPDRHGRYYKLIKKFEEKTGCPVIINTSFNVRGEPIVLSPQHAYRCFLATNMDVLVLEDCVLFKEEQSNLSAEQVDAYVKQFQLD